MNLEPVLQQIGEFGRYQKLLYFFVWLPGVFSSMQAIQVLIFNFAVPKHRCKIPGWNNDTYEIQNILHERIVNVTIPLVTSFYGNEKYSPCKMYLLNSTYEYNETDNVPFPCQEWVYDQNLYVSTIAESLDMVCEKKYLVSIGKMLVMLGQLTSSFYVGPLSDRFGRRPLIIANTFIMVLLSIVLSWVNSTPLVIVVLLCLNQAAMAQYLISFVYGMEIVSASKRMWTGTTMNLSWSVGNLFTALAAYLLRDWRTRQLIISAPGILFAYLLFLPESPRWLLKHGRFEEAKSVLLKISAGNKAEINPEDLNNSILNIDNEKRESFYHLFKSSILMRRMCILYFNWFVISMSFYGLSMNVTNLSGDIYLNFFLFVLLEVFAYILCYFLMDKLGRKKLLCMFLIGSGAAGILTLLPVLISDTPNQWAINVLAISGNTMASINFAVVFTYTSELTPTTARNSCVAFGSFWARVGSLIAPYIVDLTLYSKGRYGQILPMLIFGGMSALAGFLCLLLPETLNKRLPETIKEAEILGTPAYDDKEYQEEETPPLNMEDMTNTSNC